MVDTKMATTYRIFEKDGKDSIATIVTTKDGRLFQVKPEHKFFDTLKAWKAAHAFGPEKRIETTLSDGSKPECMTETQRVVQRATQAAAAKVSARNRPQPAIRRSIAPTVTEKIRHAKTTIHDVTQMLVSKALRDRNSSLGMIYLEASWYTRHTHNPIKTLREFKEKCNYAIPTSFLTETIPMLGLTLDSPLKEVMAALEANVAPFSDDTMLTKWKTTLAELEETLKTDPGSATRKVYSYSLHRKSVPFLFVKHSGCFVPVYASRDFNKVWIRGLDDKLYETFEGAGIHGTPQFYVMEAKRHFLQPVTMDS